MRLGMRLGTMMAAAIGVASIATGQQTGQQTGQASGQSIGRATRSDLDRAYAKRLLDETEFRSSALQADEQPVDIGGHIKFRYQVNMRNDHPSGDDATVGFELPETRIRARGRVETFDYEVSADFFPDGMVHLQDAWWRWDFENGWTLTAGQFKFGYLREELVSNTGLQAANRSIASFAFSQARSQGVELRYTTEDFRVAIGASDGLRTFNTDFVAPAEADYAFNFRGEWKFAGNDWERFDDFASFQGSDYSGMLGGAVWYQDGGETFMTFDGQVIGLTADVTIEGNGWNAFLAGIFQRFEPATGSTQEDMGLVAQAGYFLTPQWEVYGRYDAILADTAEDFSTVTVGANYYVIEGSQSLKFTADLQYYLDEQSGSASTPSTVINLLPSADDEQFGVTFQLQLVF